MKHKTNIMKIVAVAMSLVAFASFGYGYHRGPAPRYYGPRIHHAYHHNHSAWGPGGRYFWPGFIGGVVGGAIATTLPPPPVVVSPAPVVVNQTPTPVVVAPQPVVVPSRPVVVW